MALQGKRIILGVSNDLVADQRVHRTAGSLAAAGAKLLVVGRRLPRSPEVEGRPYKIRRMRLIFRRGPQFYACFNLRLFFFLLFRRADLFVSNDLDTLLACYLVSRLRRKPLVYDSHEYFTEVPELIGRNLTRRIWTGIEKRILPGIKYACTVSSPLADAFQQKYGIGMVVIRNLPIREKKEARRPDLLVCDPKRTIIYQGALNRGRGLESMITAMKYLEGFELKIFGDGNIRERLEEITNELGLGDRVEFLGRVPFQELKGITRQASLGISLEEDTGLNYRFALPNKLFDYIQAGIPVLVSDVPEMKKVVEQYQIGRVLVDRDPHKLAGVVTEMMKSDEQRAEWKKNLRKAAEELCWEREEGILLDLYTRAIKGS